MSNELDKALSLILGRLANKLTKEQDKELDEWIEQSVDNRLLYLKVKDPDFLKKLADYMNLDGQPAWDILRKQIPGLPKSYKPPYETKSTETNQPHTILLSSNGTNSVRDAEGNYTDGLPKNWFIVYLEYVESQGFDPLEMRFRALVNGKWCRFVPSRLEDGWTWKIVDEEGDRG